MTLSDVIDDQFLARYRALLDAEDEAFDELEHAFEDGDRVDLVDGRANDLVDDVADCLRRVARGRDEVSRRAKQHTFHTTG